MAVLGDGILGVQLGERSTDRRPDLVLDGRVLDDRGACAELETCGQLGDVISASDVHGIGDAGMVGGEFQH